MLQVVVDSNDRAPNGLVELSNPGGDLLGSLFVPPNLSNQANTTLTIIYTAQPPSASGDQRLASDILEITLVDSQDNLITQLDEPLTICFPLPSVQNKTKKIGKVCLGYYKERKDKWICEDQCLTTVGKNGSSSGLLCGQSSHLTNFALLLGGQAGSSDPCSSKEGNTLAWVSLGMVAGAIVLVALSVVLFEVY